jgi:hypothetical protein
MAQMDPTHHNSYGFVATQNFSNQYPMPLAGYGMPPFPGYAMNSGMPPYPSTIPLAGGQAMPFHGFPPQDPLFQQYVFTPPHVLLIRRLSL